MIYEDDEAGDESAADGRDAERDSGMGTVALAVLAGAAIGAAVALMMAPRTGRDMRRVIRKRADGLRETAGNVIDETTEDLSRELRRRGRQIRRKLDRMA
jgi:gas vesicle protein